MVSHRNRCCSRLSLPFLFTVFGGKSTRHEGIFTTHTAPHSFSLYISYAVPLLHLWLCSLRRRIRMYACIQRAKARILCWLTIQKCSHTHSQGVSIVARVSCVSVEKHFLTQIQIVCVSDNLHFPIALSTRFMSVSRACFRWLLLFLCFPYTFYMLTSSMRSLFVFSLSLSHFSIFAVCICERIVCFIDGFMSKKLTSIQSILAHFVYVLHLPLNGFSLTLHISAIFCDFIRNQKLAKLPLFLQEKHLDLHCMPMAIVWKLCTLSDCALFNYSRGEKWRDMKRRPSKHLSLG